MTREEFLEQMSAAGGDAPIEGKRADRMWDAFQEQLRDGEVSFMPNGSIRFALPLTHRLAPHVHPAVADAIEVAHAWVRSLHRRIPKRLRTNVDAVLDRTAETVRRDRRDRLGRLDRRALRDRRDRRADCLLHEGSPSHAEEPRRAPRAVCPRVAGCAARHRGALVNGARDRLQPPVSAARTADLLALVRVSSVGAGSGMRGLRQGRFLERLLHGSLY
eukprot:370933-Prymnesium_polylepis.1